MEGEGGEGAYQLSPSSNFQVNHISANSSISTGFHNIYDPNDMTSNGNPVPSILVNEPLEGSIPVTSNATMTLSLSDATGGLLRPLRGGRAAGRTAHHSRHDPYNGPEGRTPTASSATEGWGSTRRGTRSPTPSRQWSSPDTQVSGGNASANLPRTPYSAEQLRQMAENFTRTHPQVASLRNPLVHPLGIPEQPLDADSQEADSLGIIATPPGSSRPGTYVEIPVPTLTLSFQGQHRVGTLGSLTSIGVENPAVPADFSPPLYPPRPGETRYTFDTSPGPTYNWAVRTRLSWPYCHVLLYVSPYQGSWTWIPAWVHYNTSAEDGWEDNFDPVLCWLWQGEPFDRSPLPLSRDQLYRFRMAIREAVLSTHEVVEAQALYGDSIGLLSF
jgi:hypothetical protein